MRDVHGASVNLVGEVVLQLWDGGYVVYRYFDGDMVKAQACADSVNDLPDPVVVSVDGFLLVVQDPTLEVW